MTKWLPPLVTYPCVTQIRPRTWPGFQTQVDRSFLQTTHTPGLPLVSTLFFLQFFKQRILLKWEFIDKHAQILKSKDLILQCPGKVSPSSNSFTIKGLNSIECLVLDRTSLLSKLFQQSFLVLAINF